MAITRLALKQFRCFEACTIELGEGTLIEGNNGSGKSSILEALHFICYGRSFRAQSPRDLIHEGAQAFSIEVSGNDPVYGPWQIQCGHSGGSRSLKLNGAHVTRMRDILNVYRAVSITENDINLVAGYPAERRSLSDVGIMMIDPEYGLVVTTYKKAVAQRNALLAARAARESIAPWTEQVITLGRKIQEARIAWCARMQERMNELERLCLEEPVQCTISYVPRHVLIQDFQSTGSLLDAEIRTGRTLFGPHNDDIALSYNERSAKLRASRGQQKLIVFLLKSSLATLLPLKPIILVDDFVADFDKKRLATAARLLKLTGCQTILTAPVWAPFECADLIGLAPNKLVLEGPQTEGLSWTVGTKTASQDLFHL